MSEKVSLPAGKHVLRLDVTKEYFDIDYIQFVKGDGPVLVQPDLKYDPNSRQDYFVYDMHGVNMGVLSAYGFEAAAEILQSSSDVKSSGVYMLRNRATGAMQKVRVVR